MQQIKNPAGRVMNVIPNLIGTLIQSKLQS